jgi:hypothetical protein
LDRTLEIFQTVTAIVFPLQQSYFVVFDSSAHLLGRIPDIKLREQIITTYTEAKGFVDSMRYYERLVDSYNRQKTQPVQTAQQKFVSVLKPVRDAKLYAPLVVYSNQLKVAHARSEDRLRELRQLLKAFLDTPSV